MTSGVLYIESLKAKMQPEDDVETY